MDILGKLSLCLTATIQFQIVLQYYLSHLYLILQTATIPFHPFKCHIVDMACACSVSVRWGSVTNPSVVVRVECLWTPSFPEDFFSPLGAILSRDAWVGPQLVTD